jgi:hypothetical protein
LAIATPLLAENKPGTLLQLRVLQLIRTRRFTHFKEVCVLVQIPLAALTKPERQPFSILGSNQTRANLDWGYGVEVIIGDRTPGKFCSG